MASPSITISDQFVRLKRTLQSTFGLIVKIVTFASIAVFGGLLTSWYVIEQGAAFNTERIGPWVKWTLGGRLKSDPYSLIRNDQRTMLVFSSTFVSRYEATFDDSGRRLHSACHYAIEGPAPASAWWSINVFDGAGRLVPNASNRHGFNAANIVPNADGTIRIDLAREARPGNWVPTSRAGRLVVVLESQNRTGDAGVPADQVRKALPSIRRIGCR
ncbi:MAG: DUF1214 domain-containing protein [Hyphomicrobiaceae bacterium]